MRDTKSGFKSPSDFLHVPREAQDMLKKYNFGFCQPDFVWNKLWVVVQPQPAPPLITYLELLYSHHYFKVSWLKTSSSSFYQRWNYIIGQFCLVSLETTHDIEELTVVAYFRRGYEIVPQSSHGCLLQFELDSYLMLIDLNWIWTFA